MTKSAIFEYLSRELEDVGKEYEQAHKKWMEVEGVEALQVVREYNAVSAKYHYMYMICNDLGVIKR